MPARSIVVLGGGMTGLSTALALGRDGHRVTLVERDDLPASGDALDAVAWPRRGIPHFLQAHAFTSRGRKELRELFPDVFEALLEAGADDIELWRKLPDTPRPGDEDLAMLGVRRPLIEWALRRAVLAEPKIEVVSGVQADGLLGHSGPVPRITGVRLRGSSVEADLVVDAMGRRSPGAQWVEALGGTRMNEESSDCGVIYYTRYYHVREGATLPDGPWLPTPRGDLGYGLFSTFPGDNRTFAGLIAIPPGDQELKILRDATAFEAASALMPALYQWLDPEIAEPITDVLPMGSLRNTRRSLVDGRPPAVGVVSLGDALFHTDPVFALGLSFAIVEARALRDALRTPRSIDDSVLGVYATLQPAMDERYELATAVDDLRRRGWSGETLDIAHRDGGAYPVFVIAAGGAAALADGEIFRTVVRRNYFLDPLSVLDQDIAMQERMERIFGELRAIPRPRPGPSREDLIAAMREAIDRRPRSPAA